MLLSLGLPLNLELEWRLAHLGDLLASVPAQFWYCRHVCSQVFYKVLWI